MKNMKLKVSYEIALVAIMSAMAIVGRMVFQGIPNFQPATFLIIVAGYMFGKRVGMEVGFVVAIVSGLMTGLGTWTLTQILAWVVIGAVSGLLGIHGYEVSKRVFTTWVVLSAFVYGFISSFSMLFYVPLSAFFPMYITGIPFDVYHALGNIAMLVTLPVIIPVLQRYRENGRKVFFTR